MGWGDHVQGLRATTAWKMMAARTIMMTSLKDAELGLALSSFAPRSFV